VAAPRGILPLRFGRQSISFHNGDVLSPFSFGIEKVPDLVVSARHPFSLAQPVAVADCVVPPTNVDHRARTSPHSFVLGPFPVRGGAKAVIFPEGHRIFAQPEIVGQEDIADWFFIVMSGRVIFDIPHQKAAGFDAYHHRGWR